MSDNLKPDDRKRTMKAVKSKGTKLEKRLTATLAGMGISGWKKNVKSITGKPDVAFLDQKIAIFVDGCFWHGCKIHYKPPSTRSKFWSEKIVQNKKRDKKVSRELKQAGWKVVRCWEHEVVKYPEKIIGKIENALKQ